MGQRGYAAHLRAFLFSSSYSLIFDEPDSCGAGPLTRGRRPRRPVCYPNVWGLCEKPPPASLALAMVLSAAHRGGLRSSESVPVFKYLQPHFEQEKSIQGGFEWGGSPDPVRW